MYTQGWCGMGGGVNTRDLHKGKELNYHCHRCRTVVSNIMQELQSNRFAIESNKDKNKTRNTTCRSRGLFQGDHQIPQSGILFTQLRIIMKI